MSRSTVLKLAAALLVLGALAASPARQHLLSLLDPDRIDALLVSAGPFAPLAYIGLMATAVVVSPLPSLPLDIAAGRFFGPLLGTVYSVAGALLGAVLSFLIARALGRELIEKLLRGHINFCAKCSDHLLFRIVLVSRLLPAVSFDLISYGAGLTAMTLPRFALATAIGTTPPTFAYVYLGSALRVGPEVLVPAGLVVVALFFLMPRWIEKHDLFSLRDHFRHDEESAA